MPLGTGFLCSLTLQSLANAPLFPNSLSYKCTIPYLPLNHQSKSIYPPLSISPYLPNPPLIFPLLPHLLSPDIKPNPNLKTTIIPYPTLTDSLNLLRLLPYDGLASSVYPTY